MIKAILAVMIILTPIQTDAGIFFRRRCNVQSSHVPIQRIIVQQIQPQIIQQNFAASQYAYQSPLLGVSPAVIEQHSYDLANTASLRYNATAAQALRNTDSLIQLQKMQAVLAAGASSNGNTQIGGLTFNSQQPQPLQQSLSIINTKCAKCHGTDKASPKGGVFITNEMSDTVMLNALDMVRQDKMPKGKPLSREEKALFMEEIFNLRTKK